MTELRLLLGLEARALFGFNKFRFSRDKKAKRRWKLLAGTVIFLILLAWLYIGALSWGLASLGMGDIVPAYLAFIASALIFVLGLFHSGGTVFDRRGRDMIFSLPLKKSSLALARMLRLYLENLALAFAVLLPGLAVYAVMEGCGGGFAAFAALGWLLLPMLPTAASILPGALISLAAGRLRRRALWESALMILVLLAIFALSFYMGSAEDMSHEALADLAGLVSAAIGRFYPPALWFGRGEYLLNFAACSLIPAATVAAIVCRIFPAVMGRSASAAGHSPSAKSLRASGLTKALYIRELRRYFASSVYVTNTIVGPIMALTMSAALLIKGTDIFAAAPVDIVTAIPFVLAGVLGMMSPAAVALSMEGRQINVLRSLPVTRPQLLLAKLLAALSIAAPFYLASEVLLLAALRPGIAEAAVLVPVPAVGAVFSAVFGLAVDSKLGRFDWDSETAMVKQSASSALGGLGILLPTAIAVAAVILLPRTGLVAAAYCLVLAATGAILWGKLRKKAEI